MKFSIILPVYKQQGFLIKMVNEYNNALRNFKYSYELIIAINGPDQKGYDKEIEKIKKLKNIRVYKIKGAGWGLAINYGIAKSKGEFICFTNSANADPYELTPILLKAIKNPNALIKANRVEREEDWFRKAGSLLYSFENLILFGTKIKDINGFPKIYNRRLLKQLKTFSNDSLLDAELLAKTKTYSIPIIEVPVHTVRNFSKKSSTTIKTAIKLYAGVIGLRFNLKS